MMSIIKNPNLELFFGYVFFAGIATLFDWSTFYISTYLIKYNYLSSTILGFSVGSIVNFSLNKYINFKNKYKRIERQFMLFLIIAGLGLIFSLLLMYLFIDMLGINKMTSRILTTGIVLIYSFLGHKKISFEIMK